MATQAASGKGKKGGKKGKKGGGSPDKKGGKGQKNKGGKKQSSGPKDDSPASLLEHHLDNRPKEDTSKKRDEDIARFQNEAAVLEKNIREITSQIEDDKRARSALKTKRQATYDEMNAARDILQARKAEKDKVYQRIQQYRNSRNSLRGDRGKGGKGRNFRTIRELNAAIKRLENEMQTEVLSLREEKDRIREIKELNKMRPEVEKISRQNEVLQQFTENSKEQHDEDQAAYTQLKKEVQDAYQFQQGKYELFQEAVSADTTLNDSIEASIETRKQSYQRQKDIRQLITDRKRDYQKSTRDIQRWEQQSRKLKRDVEFYNRRLAREEQDRRRQEERDARKTQLDLEREEEASQDTKREASQQKQREKRRAERDDDSPKQKPKDGPRPPRTTRPPRERKEPRKPRNAQVHPAPKKDALEVQKFQLEQVVTYVKTLLPRIGEASGPDMTGKFNSHKGGFKPSRDEDMFGQDLFKSTRKSKKSKRKKKKKNKNIFFVQSHTPPIVQEAFKSLKRWLTNNGCPTAIALPMAPTEAEQCIKDLTEAQAFIIDFKGPKRTQEAAKPEEPTEQPTESAPEQSDAQPEAQASKEEPPTVDEAEPEESGAAEAEASEDVAKEATPVAEVSNDAAEPAEAQPEAADEAAPVDTKPEQPDTTVNKDDAAPAQATNENQDDEDDEDESEDEDDESSDGVEVMESMVI